MRREASPPPRCDVALKEWSGICAALLSGRQTIVLRKGGIDEGPGGFRPVHPAFWLFPTVEHEAQQGLRDAVEPRVAPSTGGVPLTGLAGIAWVGRIDRREALEPLAPFHVWTPETIARRFDYREPGLWLLALRVWRTETPRWLQPTAAQAGCRSWVELAEPLATDGLKPVLDDAEFADRLAMISQLLPGEPAEDGL